MNREAAASRDSQASRRITTLKSNLNHLAAFVVLAACPPGGGMRQYASLPAGVSPLVTIQARSPAPEASYRSSAMTVAQRSAPKGIGLSHCGVIAGGGDYYLLKDVTCTHRSFALNADGIRLNLNGHKITYGSNDSVVPAVSICDQWYRQLPAVRCGNSRHANPEIFNGRIVQAPGSQPFTHAIWLGQANGLTGGSIHDLTITIQEPGTQAIHADYAGDGWSIHNNTIRNRVISIEHPDQGTLSARSQFQGYAIWMNSGYNNTGRGNAIFANTLDGSPQGGIYDSNQNSRIYGNAIHLTSSYSNDYGILIMADGQQVYGNLVDGRGRGIDAESSRFHIVSNVVRVYEEPNNSEYNGCELGGVYGIRVKNYEGNPPSSGWEIRGNTVEVSAGSCKAHALQFSDLGPEVEGIVSGNSFMTHAGTQPDYAVGFSGVNQPKIHFVRNRFEASVCVLIGNDGSADGANVAIQEGQNWNCRDHVVHDTDLSREGRSPYLQALTIHDSLRNRSVLCGDYSSGTIQIGETIKHCGK